MNIETALLSARTLSDHRLEKETDESSDESVALRAFEAQMIAQVLKGSESEDEDRLFDGGSAGRMYRDHFHEEIARVLAEKGGIGLTALLQERLEESSNESGNDEPRTKTQGGG